MIKMWCDHCGNEIPRKLNGGVRVRTSDRELRLHLCEADQDELRKIIQEFADGKAQDVTPSLRKP